MGRSSKKTQVLNLSKMRFYLEQLHPWFGDGFAMAEQMHGSTHAYTVLQITMNCADPEHV